MFGLPHPGFQSQMKVYRDSLLKMECHPGGDCYWAGVRSKLHQWFVTLFSEDAPLKNFPESNSKFAPETCWERETIRLSFEQKAKKVRGGNVSFREGTNWNSPTDEALENQMIFRWMFSFSFPESFQGEFVFPLPPPTKKRRAWQFCEFVTFLGWWVSENVTRNQWRSYVTNLQRYRGY